MPYGGVENVGFGFWSSAVRAAPQVNDSTHDYRDRAARLRALAAGSLDPQTRAYLLTTAAQFDRLADYAAASAAPTHAA
jgi:hypothetical protein